MLTINDFRGGGNLSGSEGDQCTPDQVNHDFIIILEDFRCGEPLQNQSNLKVDFTKK